MAVSYKSPSSFHGPVVAEQRFRGPVRKPGRLRQSEPLAIVRVKGLDFECGAVGLRKQRNAAIRHSAVDVHEEQFDFGSAFLLAKPGQGSLRKRKNIKVKARSTHANGS